MYALKRESVWPFVCCVASTPTILIVVLGFRVGSTGFNVFIFSGCFDYFLTDLNVSQLHVGVVNVTMDTDVIHAIVYVLSPP